MLKQIFRFLIYFVCLTMVMPIFANAVYHYALKNGLQIYVKLDHRSPVVTTQIWYKVGSSYEHPGITGISHALEHMMFQGTPKYPKGKLLSIISSNGGMQNAATSYDYTFYYQELPAQKLALSFQLEADRMKNLALLPQNFAKELQVIKEERKLRVDNNPQALAYEQFSQTAYLNSYQHPVIGYMQDINNFTVKKLRHWYSQWYTPNNAILVVVGDVKPTQVYALAKKYFGKIPARKLAVTKTNITQAPTKKRTITIKLPAKVPLVLMGYNVPVLTTTKNPQQIYALLALAGILDAGPSARVAKEIIRNQQIAASASVYYDPFSRLNSLFICAGVPSPLHTPEQLVQAFTQQIQQLQTTLVAKAELERVKAQIISSKIYAKDSLANQANEIGSLVSVGLPWKTGETFVANMQKVTPQQIRKAAQKFLIAKNLTIGILEPINQGHNNEDV